MIDKILSKFNVLYTTQDASNFNNYIFYVEIVRNGIAMPMTISYQITDNSSDMSVVCTPYLSLYALKWSDYWCVGNSTKYLNKYTEDELLDIIEEVFIIN